MLLDLSLSTFIVYVTSLSIPDPPQVYWQDDSGNICNLGWVVPFSVMSPQLAVGVPC